MSPRGLRRPVRALPVELVLEPRRSVPPFWLARAPWSSTYVSSAGSLYPAGFLFHKRSRFLTFCIPPCKSLFTRRMIPRPFEGSHVDGTESFKTELELILNPLAHRKRSRPGSVKCGFIEIGFATVLAQNEPTTSFPQQPGNRTTHFFSSSFPAAAGLHPHWRGAIPPLPLRGLAPRLFPFLARRQRWNPPRQGDEGTVTAQRALLGFKDDVTLQAQTCLSQVKASSVGVVFPKAPTHQVISGGSVPSPRGGTSRVLPRPETSCPGGSSGVRSPPATLHNRIEARPTDS